MSESLPGFSESYADYKAHNPQDFEPVATQAPAQSAPTAPKVPAAPANGAPVAPKNTVPAPQAPSAPAAPQAPAHSAPPASAVPPVDEDVEAALEEATEHTEFSPYFLSLLTPVEQLDSYRAALLLAKSEELSDLDEKSTTQTMLAMAELNKFIADNYLPDANKLAWRQHDTLSNMFHITRASIIYMTEAGKLVAS